MDRIGRLDAMVDAHSLNEHPFYVAWRAGALPRAALADYAAEYGGFIAMLPAAWDAIGEHGYAREERAHTALWQDFRAALGAAEPAPHDETRALLAEATSVFATRSEALGAMYAFESQQPDTARSKLEGLRSHRDRYEIDETAARYFEAHTRETDELPMLRAALESLTDDEFAHAARACQRLCRAMLVALDGVTPAGIC
jgi:pyrroloquinoline-quinone synthase